MEPRIDNPAAAIEYGVLTITGDLVASTIGDIEHRLSKIESDSIEIIDGSGITVLDTSGAVFINRLTTEKTALRGFSDSAKKLLEISAPVEKAEPVKPEKPVRMTLERFGGLALREFERATDIAVLIVDILYWSIIGIFDRRQYRTGSCIEQAFYIGATALPIIGIILFARIPTRLPSCLCVFVVNKKNPPCLSTVVVQSSPDQLDK